MKNKLEPNSNEFISINVINLQFCQMYSSFVLFIFDVEMSLLFIKMSHVPLSIVNCQSCAKKLHGNFPKGRNEERRVAAPTSFSTFDSYDMKT